LPIDFSNNCNKGYAFINFVHYAYILDFYFEYNNKGWQTYNGEKVCKITYGAFQGKNELLKKFGNSRVWKSSNNKIKPFIGNTKKINDDEIKQILDKHYRRRFKEKAEITEKVYEEDKSIDNKNVVCGQIKLSDLPDNKETESFQKDLSDIPKILQVFEKRNSQKPSENNTKLDKQEQVKRPASDDDKGINSDEDKKSGKRDKSSVKNKLKLNLKNICLTSR
jgi:hypothetical protein